MAAEVIKYKNWHGRWWSMAKNATIQVGSFHARWFLFNPEYEIMANQRRFITVYDTTVPWTFITLLVTVHHRPCVHLLRRTIQNHEKLNGQVKAKRMSRAREDRIFSRSSRSWFITDGEKSLLGSAQYCSECHHHQDENLLFDDTYNEDDNSWVRLLMTNIPTR